MNDGTLLFVNFAVYSWLVLVPVICVEGYELGRTLPISTGRAAAVSALANLASVTLCTLAVFAAGWLLGFLDVIAEPHAGEGDVAALIALVPCFFLSLWAERLVALPLLRNHPREAVLGTILRANQLGYAMLAIVPVVRFLKSALVNGRLIW